MGSRPLIKHGVAKGAVKVATGSWEATPLTPKEKDIAATRGWLRDAVILGGFPPSTLRIGQIIVGLVYLWVRDAELPLNDGTREHIREHWEALKDGEIQYSNEELYQFVFETLDYEE